MKQNQTEPTRRRAPGAGRPAKPAAEKFIRRSFAIPPAQLAALEALDGNPSDHLRQALQQYLAVRR